MPVVLELASRAPAAPLLAPEARHSHGILTSIAPDNYIDIIVDSSTLAAAEAITTVWAFQTDLGYSSLYNPGGPGNDPIPGVRYSSAAPPQVCMLGW